METHSVWFDFGDGFPERFDFESGYELDAFIDGVSAAAHAFGIDDYRQFDTEEEVIAEFGDVVVSLNEAL